MGRPIVVSNIEDFVRRYESGETIKAMAKEIGIGKQALTRHLKAAGLVPHTGLKPGIRPLRPIDEWFIDRYLAGEPITTLAPEAGVAQGTFKKRLLARGISPRSVAQTIDRCHEAVRGTKHSEDALLRRAATREVFCRTSPNEQQLAMLLGVPVTMQKAIGKYNVDLAIGHSVAVEVCGGGWHLEKRHRLRSEYLFDQGWNLMFVWVDQVRHPLNVEAAKEVLAFCEQTERDPTFRRQYRMVWGSGELISAGSADSDEWTLIGPGKRRLH